MSSRKFRKDRCPTCGKDTKHLPKFRYCCPKNGNYMNLGAMFIKDRIAQEEAFLRSAYVLNPRLRDK